MVLAFILDAVGHHQIGVLRWHDRLQGAWAFVILTLGLSWIRATELYWVLVYTLFERISREGEVILPTGSIDLQINIYTSFNTCPSIPGIAASLPSFPSHFVGEEKKGASEHLQKRAQTRASEHLSATSATTPPHDQPSSPRLHRGRRLGFSVDFFVPTSNVGCGPTPLSNFTRRGFFYLVGRSPAMGYAANLSLVVNLGSGTAGGWHRRWVSIG